MSMLHHPELVSDFAVPDGLDESELDGGFFTYAGLRDFPALNGTGLSLELLEFPSGAVNVPHTHPRGAELLFVVEGALKVGLTDSNGKLYRNVLQKGDVFAFPKGC
ncbi:hypothetical protein AMTRI_Chr08g202840 [Amborella trichopoda]